MKLFKAVNMNWSCHCIGDWTETVYIIDADGSYVKTIKTSEEPNPLYPDEVTQGKFSQEQFQELHELLLSFPRQQTRRDCCDGEGWEMTFFGNHGKILYRTNGYIYGVEVLEKIASIMP